MYIEFHRNNIEPEWQDLVEEYPEIFLEPSEYVLDLYNTHYANNDDENLPKSLDEVSNLRYSFECSIGWKEIIRDFCKKIRALVEYAKSEGHEIVYKTCILKEKFGSISDQGDFYGEDARLYYADYRKISNELEDASGKTCELCGKPGGVVSNKGWYKCRCASCK